eukprot:6473846-Amphidinium_carterae.2
MFPLSNTKTRWTLTVRVGEAKNPGPLMCSCNTGAWRMEPGCQALSSNAGLPALRRNLGYHNAFIPVLGTAGKPRLSGG